MHTVHCTGNQSPQRGLTGFHRERRTEEQTDMRKGLKDFVTFWAAALCRITVRHCVRARVLLNITGLGRSLVPLSSLIPPALVIELLRISAAICSFRPFEGKTSDAALFFVLLLFFVLFSLQGKQRRLWLFSIDYSIVLFFEGAIEGIARANLSLFACVYLVRRKENELRYNISLHLSHYQS